MSLGRITGIPPTCVVASFNQRNADLSAKWHDPLGSPDSAHGCVPGRTPSVILASAHYFGRLAAIKVLEEVQ
jgi:hypothetical protein